jgi:hypothetical protein
MHTAIELDRQFAGVTIKVSDLSFDHLLSAEVKPVHRVSAKGFQSRRSARSHFTAQSFGEGELIGINVLAARDFAAATHQRVGCSR